MASQKIQEPRTLSLLYDAIDNDYSWRITELSNFRSTLLSENSERAQKALVRAGVALLYAHWEGFVKKITDLYYEHVSYQNLKIEELNNSFTGIVLRSEIEQLLSSKKIMQHAKLVQILFDEKSKKAFFSSTSPIRTSNLKFEIFEDVCEMIGISPALFSERYKRDFDRNIQLTIDEDLVARRNSIAHGEYLPIKLDDFKTLYDVVVNGFLYNFKEVIMEAAQSKNYCRMPNVA